MIDTRVMDAIMMSSIVVFFCLWFWLLWYLYVTYKDFYEYLELLYSGNLERINAKFGNNENNNNNDSIDDLDEGDDVEQKDDGEEVEVEMDHIIITTNSNWNFSSLISHFIIL